METAGIRAATWVVGKALSPLSGGLLEAWGASSMLGSNMEALKMQLLYAQAMLNNVQGREIHNPALGELLDKLQQLAYGADDLLDELDYFRIQDELDGTYHAADTHAAGCVQELVLNARHTARSCMNKLKLPACSRAARATHDDPDEQQDGVKQGCFSRICSCGRCENQLVGQKVDKGCMLKVASTTRNAARTVGKHFPCYSFRSAHDDDSNTSTSGQRFLCGGLQSSKAPQRNHDAQAPKLKFDRVEKSTKIRDIVEQLKPVCAMVSTILNLQLLGSNRSTGLETSMNKAQTTPEIVEPKLYGRESQKNIVVDEIVNGECCALTVLPVVGPGGIGKTTFIQHIYEQLKSQFQVPIWVCVSLDFNANRLAKDIVKKIPKVDNEKPDWSDEDIIGQRIKGKRVLLVLDDVWTHHENEWTKLLALFKKEGAKGNMVIVTTRIPEVANRVKTTKCSLELERLSPQDIMSFFEECVFGGQKPWVEQPGLAEVGSKIVEKLKGSPLAAKTVGRLLRNKLTMNHWISILESKEWESQTNDNDIMPALKLSYDYLPLHLQKCFSFCALFPEDYEFGSEELVHLWIGLDILHSCDRRKKKIEDVGLCFLNELVNHGFFKINKNVNGIFYYVIHDLLHELALHVSSYECLSIYSSNIKHIQIPPTVRYLSITVDNTDVMNRLSFEDYNENLTALGRRLKVENLHTLMLFGDYHGSFVKTFGGLFRDAKAIRVIFLSGASYAVGDLFHNFANLLHLRYLRLTGTSSLPSVLFRLYHLEVLDIQSASGCLISTRQMINLVNLRHFLLPKCKPELGISQVGKLKFLQEIKEFRVGKESEGFELSQLGQLKEIGGSLVLYNLEKVQTKEEADKLKLIHKNHLRKLILEWDVARPNKNPVQEENILESLVPHGSLQELHINYHGGTHCPTWLCDNLSVKCLESLCLEGVSWKNLPPLGEMWMVNEHGEEYQSCSISPLSFHNLKMLQLINISSLTKWVGNGPCPFFSNLESLVVIDCSELLQLPFSHPTSCQSQQEEEICWFPRLQKLVIVDCPKLVSLPPIPWRIHAPCCAEIVTVGSSFENLIYLGPWENGTKAWMLVEGKLGLDGVLWNGLNFSNLTDLEDLEMKKCPPLPLDGFQLLASLKRINISCLSNILPPVQGKGHGMYHFPCENLKISNCDTSGEELTLLLYFLPNISNLEIEDCDNITGLGVTENAGTICREEQQQIRGLTAEGPLFLPLQLQELLIYGCSKVSLLSNRSHDDHTGQVGLQRLCSLRVLLVTNCPEFLSSYSCSSFCLFPSSLQYLTLGRLNRTETLTNLTCLTDLTLLISGGLKDEGLWPLLAHGRLTKLDVSALDFFTGSDLSRPLDIERFSRSSKLFNLRTSIRTGFLAAPICSLLYSTLTELDLSFTDEVERLTKEQEEALQLLTSLQNLTFTGGDKLQHLPTGLHKLTSLKDLQICDFEVIRSLPSLPSCLRKLGVHRCDALKSLPNSLPSSLEELKISLCNTIESLPNSLPSFLEKLKIHYCKAIKSLPKDGLPSSMQELDVRGTTSDELKRECRKLIGTIPIVRA